MKKLKRNMAKMARLNNQSPLMQKPIRPGAHLRDPVGIGLRHQHYADVVDQRPDVGWMEVHPENYFGGGINRAYLREIAGTYPLSFHAVGLSLGSAQDVDENHLHQIKTLIEEFEPFQFSDHASWSASGNAHLNDLLPLPYTEETLSRLCRNIDATQDYLGRAILVENPSTYVAFKDNEMGEADFMNRAAARTGCWLLLDINNIYVQCRNHDFDPFEYIATINPASVAEMHLAGHSEVETRSKGTLLVDTHNDYVRNEVWELYGFAIQRFGAVPTLIEWDQDLPELKDLVAEAGKARDVLRQHGCFTDIGEIHAAE